MSGPLCFENPPSLTSPSNETGTVQELAGLKTYVTGPPHSKRAILLISDVFGFEAPLLRKLADKVAGEGFLVVVPDLLYGDYYDLNNPQFDRDTWKKAHAPDKASEDTKPLIAALRSKGVTAIGAAGFCWGGVVVAKLAVSDDIQVAVLLHPGPITVEEINSNLVLFNVFKFILELVSSPYVLEVKVPIAILGAEIDSVFPSEKLNQYGEILSAKAQFESFVKTYPGVSHGWTVRYNVEDEAAVKSAEEAHQDMLNWFTKHIK